MSSKYVIDGDRHHDDPEWLREQYWEKGLTLEEVAEKAGYSSNTIRNRFKEYDIPIRTSGKVVHEEKKFWDEDWLREQYWEEGKSLKDIADMCDADDESVRQMMKRRGIERRERKKFHPTEPVNLTVDGTGHPIWLHKYDGSLHNIGVHRLAVILGGADPHDVFDEDTVVHHENHIPFDNRPDNLTLMDKGDHLRHHNRDYYDS